MKKQFGLLSGLLILALMVNQNLSAQTEKPNVLLVMVDDLGIEGISAYGSKIQTPNIDALAANNGVQVSHCFAQPNCTPSRVKLMTGMRTYKSFDRWSYLNPKHKTFGNLMQEAGYKTAIAGKWQLNGNAKMSGYVPEHNHIDRATQAGFDEYHLHNYIGKEGERYANSVVDSNGERVRGSYGPDMHRDFIQGFIKRNKQNPFFVYYPMVLVHGSYTQTPDSDDWGKPSSKKKGGQYLIDMVKYTDKIVGQLVETLKQEGVYENTIIIFTCDNGTGRGGNIDTANGKVRGGKGTMTDAGTRVPLIIHYPAKIKQAAYWEGLIEFSDFYPTLADIAGVNVQKEKDLDGTSFLPLVEGMPQDFKSRKVLLMHHDPRRDDNAKRIETDSTNRNRFARTIGYKLYQTGQFYNIQQDVLEQNVLDVKSLGKTETKIYKQLKAKLNKINKQYPWQDVWPKQN